MAITSTPLTLEQFLALPEAEPSLEYIDGVVAQKVSPRARHSALQAALIKHLDQAGLRGQVARAFPELRTTFAGESRVPDVAVYRWERIPRDANGEIEDDVVEPPDIAIEIVSPGQSVNALNRRCLWYATHGVQVALLVDPVDKSVLAFRSDGRVRAWRGSDRIDLSEIVPELELTVEQLFESLR